MEFEQMISSTFGNTEASLNTPNLEEKESQTEASPSILIPQIEPQRTPAIAEAPAHQTSFDEDQIVAEVVANINAALEEEIVGDGGGEEPMKARVISLQHPYFLCLGVWEIQRWSSCVFWWMENRLGFPYNSLLWLPNTVLEPCRYNRRAKGDVEGSIAWPILRW